MPVIYTAGLGA